jgi:hypothetical protein
MKSLFFYPVINVALVVALVLYWVIVTALLSSIDNEVVKDKVLNSAQVSVGFIVAQYSASMCLKLRGVHAIARCSFDTCLVYLSSSLLFLLSLVRLIGLNLNLILVSVQYPLSSADLVELVESSVRQRHNWCQRVGLLRLADEGGAHLP